MHHADEGTRFGMATARTKKLILNGGLSVLLVGGAVAGYLLLRPADPQESSGEGQLPTVPVMVSQVSATAGASGKIESQSSQVVNFGGSGGTVATVDVAVGQAVTAGQQLATLDGEAAQLALSAANASYEAAEANLLSAKENLKTVKEGTPDETGAVVPPTKAQLATAEAGVSTAQASLDQAAADVASKQQAVDAGVLLAPIDGTVTEINGAVGGQASGGGGSSGGDSGSDDGASNPYGMPGGGDTSGGDTSSGFMKISNLGALQIVCTFSEADAAKIAIGQAARISFPVLPGVEAQGTVSNVAFSATTTQQGATGFKVTIALSAAPEGVRLGQSGDVVVIFAESTPEALAIPSSAVTMLEPGKFQVTVVDDQGNQTPTPVEIGVEGDFLTEITSGLEEGQLVLDGGGMGPDGFPDGGFPGGAVESAAPAGK